MRPILVTMATLVLASGVAVARSPAATGQPSIDVHVSIADSIFGVVTAQDGSGCLRTHTRPLNPGDAVLIILPAEGEAHRAIVTEALAATCSGEPPEPGVSYFRVSAAALEAGGIGIAVLAGDAASADGTTTDIDGDGTPESYRSCTSSEGVHLSVWAGEALRGRRIWHHYHYLGYNVEPTCVDADFETRGIAPDVRVPDRPPCPNRERP